MKDHLIVSLEGVEMKAYHGVYDFERENGNDFIIDIKVETEVGTGENFELSTTVNYETLFAIIQEEMKITSKLLEEVVKRIADRTLMSFEMINWVEVSLAKKNPPIEGKCKSARVTLRKVRGQN